MRTLFLTLLLIGPALADTGHDGIVRPRNMPELSDVALFVLAVVAIWLTRRALRRRFAAKD